MSSTRKTQKHSAGAGSAARTGCRRPRSPLHAAAVRGRAELLQLLLSTKAGESEELFVWSKPNGIDPILVGSGEFPSFGIPFWLGVVNSPPTLEPTLVVGLNRMFTGVWLKMKEQMGYAV